MSTVPVGPRRRILVAVQPRVLGDALATVLESIGLDDVLTSGHEGADRPPMPYDAVILSETDAPVDADVVIHLSDDSEGALSHVTVDDESVVIDLRTPQELLSVLDRYCPTTAARAAPVT